MMTRFLDSLRSKYQHRRREIWYKERGLNSARSIATHMTEPEKVSLFELALASREKGDVVEIGSYVGASTCYLSAGLRGSSSRVYCVDTWNNETMPDGIRDTYHEFMTNTSSFGDLVVPVRKRSEALERADVGERIGLAFLDGDHSYDAVSREIHLLTEWMAKGSIMALHDILYFDGVVKAYCEAVAGGKWLPRGQTNNLIWMEKR